MSRCLAVAATVTTALAVGSLLSSNAFVQTGVNSRGSDEAIRLSALSRPARLALRQATAASYQSAAGATASSSSGSSSFAAGWQAVAGVALLCAASMARRSSVACRVNKLRDLEYQEDEEWYFGMPDKPNPQYDQRMGYRINGSPGKPGSPHAWTEKIRWCNRFKTRIHIRRKVEGNTARPRLAVFRSQDHMHAQVIDDTAGVGRTLAAANTRQQHNKEEIRKVDEKAKKSEEGKAFYRSWTMEAAEVVGKDIAKKCLENNITQVVFDRGGFPYEGRVKALAEAARSAGLQF